MRLFYITTIMNVEENKIGRYEFLAEPFHCDFSNRLLMGHLGNHMLNAADFHSNDRGFGMHYLNTVNKTWVLSRLAIEMEQMPMAYDRFAVVTWVESAKRFFTRRNFMVQDSKSGRVFGYGNSIWAMIDTESRQPVNLLDVKDGLLSQYVVEDYPCPIEKGSRVKMDNNALLVGSVMARYNDIDINGHVNSVKYIEHVLDLFPLSLYKELRLARFDIAYVAEAHYGDELRFYSETDDNRVYRVRITRSNPESVEEVETCRCMLCFTDK